MQQFPFWHQQTADKPLFPDIEWSKPEQRARAGRLAIIGGNKLGFTGAATAYSVALGTGAGEAKVLLPDVLKKSIPAFITEAQFTASNISGSISRDALADMRAIAAWGTGVLLIGDAGRSSETAIVYEDFIRDYHGQITLTRDAIDLVAGSYEQLLEREKTLFIASFAQTQKLFRSVYYPRVLTFNMQLAQLVDALHKFTTTYPATIATFHKDAFIVAHGGEVVTMPWQQPLEIWRGVTATKAATYLLWNPTKPLAAVSASLADTNR